MIKIEVQIRFDEDLAELKNLMIKNLKSPGINLKRTAVKLKKTINQLIEKLFERRYTELLSKYRNVDREHVLKQAPQTDILWKEILDDAAKQECCVIL